ncbi:MAG: DUF3124 domain-containing protein [Syntrophobacteraceae bacterium]
MKNTGSRSMLLTAVCLWFLACFFVSGGHAASESKLSSGQTVYVPVYSHIYHGDRGRTLNLTITLSIRNIDPARSITVNSVNYHDSRGKLIKGFAQKPVELAPLASTYYLVEESDVTGGDAPSFLVRWKADHKVNPPIVEGIMIGTASNQGISFVLPGQVIEE